MKSLLVLVALIFGVQAQAKVNFMEAMMYSYPETIDSKLNNCKTCHTIDKWQRNSYGLSLQTYLRDNLEGEWSPTVVYNFEEIIEAMQAVEAIDSDGDGFSNGDEFHNLTSPGDASDKPLN